MVSRQLPPDPVFSKRPPNTKLSENAKNWDGTTSYTTTDRYGTGRKKRTRRRKKKKDAPKLEWIGLTRKRRLAKEKRRHVLLLVPFFCVLFSIGFWSERFPEIGIESVAY